MILCTSTNCNYRFQCGRQARSDLDDTNDTYYNFEYGGCDISNGFSDYISDIERSINEFKWK